MDKKCLLVITTGLALVVLALPAHAQSVSAVFNGPQNMDAGLQNVLNNLTAYVAFLLPNFKAFKANKLYAAVGRLPQRTKATSFSMWL